MDQTTPVIAQKCRIIRNMFIPMRDGIRLATSIYLPLSEGSYPVVLIRTAYNRTFSFDLFYPSNNIALVIQDVRGRYDSEGEFYPFINETEDGYDTLEWIADQPWCNGKIGMLGDSYLAATQFLAAPAASKYLSALNPRFMAGDCWKQAYYSSGAFSLALTWSWFCFEVASRVSHANEMPLFDVQSLLQHLPVSELDEESGAGVVPFYRDYIDHSTYDRFWEELSTRDKYDSFDMPVLLVGGWYDYYPGETVHNFNGLISQNISSEITSSHRIIIGPWTHGLNPSTTLGELDFGEDSLVENNCTQRWLNCILNDKKASDFQEAPIRIFVMGLNKWRDEYEWPLSRTVFTEYYLHASGRLDVAAPCENSTTDSYIYDPENPVPSVGGNHSVGPYNPGLYEILKPGPYDQSSIELRDDVIVYTTDILKTDVEITGPVIADIYVSSSALDTDFIARLTDVYPDGRSINITEGILRMRFRENVWGKPVLMEPGEIYKISIDLQPTSNVFLAGHRIRLQITSSSFPLWDRNLNTGEDCGTGVQMLSAEQKIYHDKEHPSCITLPVIPY